MKKAVHSSASAFQRRGSDTGARGPAPLATVRGARRAGAANCSATRSFAKVAAIGRLDTVGSFRSLRERPSIRGLDKTSQRGGRFGQPAQPARNAANLRSSSARSTALAVSSIARS